MIAKLLGCAGSLLWLVHVACAAHGPGDALAAHKAHKEVARAAEAFGRRQGQRTTLHDARVSRSGSGELEQANGALEPTSERKETYDQWQSRCERRLKQAGLWTQVQQGRWDGTDHDHWEFAPAPSLPLPPSPSSPSAAAGAGEARELRVLWMMGNGSPHCFKNRGRRCVPLFERDFLFDWVLRDLPVRRRS